MRIHNLELRAKVVVEGFWSGLHRSPYHGFSVEFSEYRPYTPGDDPRYLDWRLYARTDRYYIKKFEDETNLRCHLIVDHSRSMEFSSLTHSKKEFAATLAAALALFLHQQGDAVGLLTFDEQLREYLPPRHRPGHLRQLMLALENEAQGHSTNLFHPLERIAELTTRRGLIVMISDFLVPLETLEGHLARLPARGHDLLLFQVLDPSEITFAFGQASLFEDMESGRDLYIDPELAQRQYTARIESHNARLKELAARLGIGLTVLQTDQPLERALLEFLRQRAQRKRFRRHSPRSRP